MSTATATDAGTLEHALRFVARGLPVLPLHNPVGDDDALACSCGNSECSSPAKHPRTATGVNAATTDATALRKMWVPDANIGIACGRGLVVLDIDGPDAAARLAELEAEHGPLPATTTVATGRDGGGEHRYFRAQDGAAPRDLGRGLEVRGKGRYVVAPHSRHISGRYYTVTNSTPPADAPNWLVASAGRNGRASEVGDAIANGSRNNTLTSLAGTMRRRGMAAAEIEAALLVTNRERCTPPLEDAEVRKIASSVARYKPTAAGGETSGATDPRKELAELWGVAAVNDAVASCRIVGKGGGASVDVKFQSGNSIEDIALRELGKPNVLAIEIASATGAEPRLNGRTALRSVVLLRQIAEREELSTEDDRAIDWGISFLQEADRIDIDIDDQSERWRAFELLGQRQPQSMIAAEGGSIAGASLVLVGVDGTRYVRCGWFDAHVRSLDRGMSPQTIRLRMRRVGWLTRNSQGRIKATCPGGLSAPLSWAFFEVPVDWGSGYGVTAGSSITTRAEGASPSRATAVTRRNRVTGGDRP